MIENISSQEKLQLVTFEQAKKLKDLGFDLDCNMFYSTNGEITEINKICVYDKQYAKEFFVYPAPSVALALKWFRVEYSLMGCVIYDHTVGEAYHHYTYTYTLGARYHKCFDSYEKAECQLLNKLIEIANSHNNSK